MEDKKNNNTEHKERNDLLDIIKGVAIVLMLYGHCIQYGSGQLFYNNQLFFDNIVFKYIYGFHMPLLALVSGYLFYYSNKKKWLSILKNKANKLLLPIFSWSIIWFIIISLFLDRAINFSLIFFVNFFLNYFWFLWSILFSSIIIVIIKTIFKDNIIIYLITIILMFIVKDVYHFNYNNTSLIYIDLALFKYTYIYFLSAYIFQKYKEINITNIINNRILIYALILCTILYVKFISFWNINAYIYVSGLTLIGKVNPVKQFIIDIFRYITGYLGSVSCILIVYFLYNHLKMSKIFKILSYIGRKTLSIYVISSCMFYYIVLKYTKNYSYNTFNLIIICVIILVVSLIINWIIEKFKITKKVFFGNR